MSHYLASTIEAHEMASTPYASFREMAEIIRKIESRFASALIADAWYQSEPLPGFSGLTAMQLVRDGRAEEVLDYIDVVDAGVHA